MLGALQSVHQLYKLLQSRFSQDVNKKKTVLELQLEMFCSRQLKIKPGLVASGALRLRGGAGANS